MKNKPKKIKILYLTAEAAPLAKVGGLADVAGALPKALAGPGVDIKLCLPLYGSIDRKKYKLKPTGISAPVLFDGKREIINLWRTFLPRTKIPLYLFEHALFAGNAIYQGPAKTSGNKYTRDSDEIKRFAFFTAAALAAARVLNFQPDIVHANDWHTGLTSDFIKTLNRQNSFFKKTRTLYTIHNLANQGIAPVSIIKQSGLEPNLKTVRQDAADGDVVMMVQGILASDLINTVSPTYARQILTEEDGAGLQKVLALRKKSLYGILNGIDTDYYNPAADKLIKRTYNLKTIDRKAENKLALQKQSGLPRDKRIAVVGLVSRLVWQKGLELIDEALIKNFQSRCQFVFLGTGEKKYEDQLKQLAKKYPEQVSARIKFDEKLAHQVYAGSDIFLVPSRFEPCGLTQMIAMRYGAAPLVRATGGLKDTVKNFQFSNPKSQTNSKSKIQNLKSTGFTFQPFSSSALRQTLTKALSIYYHHPAVWRQLQENGMKKDFSWYRSAKEYLKLYKKLAKTA